MIHVRWEFEIYDLNSYELKTIIQSKLESGDKSFNSYG
jgi:hypothetical protein